MEVILGIVIALLIGIIALLVIIIFSLRNKNVQRKEEVEFIIKQSMKRAYKQENKKIAAARAEEQKVARWVKETLKEGDIDFSKLTNEAQQHTFALAIRKAEDAVVSAENGLDSIRQEILKAQQDLPSKVYQASSGPYEKHDDAMKRLYEKETEAEKRVTDARSNLTELSKMILAAQPPNDSLVS